MFFITVSNGLLDGNHQKRMGAAVWQFMWLLDKITRIDEDGWGWVLGGKPINRKDFKGVHVKTVSINLGKLEQAGYITIRHTPYGMVIKVAKAQKRFGKRSGENTTPKTERNNENATAGNENVIPLRENVIPNIRHNSKTKHIDNTVTLSAQSAEGEATKVKNKVIADLIDGFKEVNPTHKRLFGMPPQRAAMGRLLDQFGEVTMRGMISFLPKNNTTKFAPVVTTPVQLEHKLGELKAFWQKEKNGNLGVISV